MKRVAGKVTKIDDFFGRKSKSSEDNALAKLKKQVQKNKSIGRPHAIKFSWAILCLLYNIAIRIRNIKIFGIYNAVTFLIAFFISAIC